MNTPNLIGLHGDKKLVPKDHTVLYAGEYTLVVKPNHGNPETPEFWFGVASPWLSHIKNDNRNNERIRTLADNMLRQRVANFRLYWDTLAIIHGIDPNYHGH